MLVLLLVFVLVHLTRPVKTVAKQSENDHLHKLAASD